MLRILAVLGLFTLTLSMSFDHDYDFGGNDESAVETLLRKQGFSDDDVSLILQEDRETREDMETEEEEEYIPWEEAKGYDECEEFMWWRKKYGKKDWKEEDWADKRKEWLDNEVDDNEVKEGDTNDQYKFDGTYQRGKQGYHGKHGSHGKRKGKGNCPGKPKPLDQICKEYECPPAKKLNISGCGFEARKVFGAHWVVTPIDTSDMRSGYQAAFWRLFKYISGYNDQSQKMDMTVPVLNKWFLDEKYQVEGAQMAFYIPAEFQAAPPNATDTLVTVEKWEDAIVYDRAFGGDRSDPEYYKKQFMYLWRALKKEGLTAYPRMSITAGYTRPGWGRQRREVMLLDNGSA